ncbi:MAG: hypothetical protein RLZZ329_791, partial [Pseudomonadota bacterium]
AHQTVALAGAIELLHSIVDDIWTVCTSANTNLGRARLEAAGLPVPKHLVTANHVERGKPHPDPYLLGAERLGFAPEDCVVFEDAIAGAAAAEAAGFLFPLSLGAEGSCTIGGNLGTNAGGTQVVRYGNTRELCLGLEVVTAQGEVWHGLSGLRKDNTGYDLRNLMIGSEGTLGIITAATMKLYPQPAAQLTAWAAVPSMQAAVQLLGLAHQRLGPGLTGFEVMGQFALGLVDKHYPQLRVPLWKDTPWCVLLENSDSENEQHARSQFEALLEAAMEQGYASDAVVAENLTQARGLWHIRESITLAQAQEGLNIKHDISIPVSRIPAFVAETDALLAREVPGVRMVDFGHLGDGNLHYNVQAPEGVDGQTFLRENEERVNTLVFDQVTKFDGSISAEHGVGELKVGKLPLYKDPTALAMMRAVKKALDPQNLLNPGRVLA